MRSTRSIPNRILQNANLPAFKKEAVVGPNTIAINEAGAKTELDFFQLFWSEEKMQQYVTNSNWYGKKYIKNWYDLTMAEFKTFLAIVMELGRVKYPSRDAAFQNSSRGSRFVNIVGIPLARFNAIVKAWRYEDYSNLTTEQIAQSKRNDPFWPIKKFAEDLASRFQSLYQCRQGLDIDEQTVPFKGRHKFIFYSLAR